MDLGLEAYIKQCQDLGMSHADILAALKTAGWRDEQLVDFKTPDLTPKSSASRVKKVLIASTLSIVILLLPLSGVMYAAEQGYLPAVSRVYRKTALPLLWKSTNANGPLSMGRVLVAQAAGGTTQKATIGFDVSIMSTSGAKITTLLPGITKVLHFADIAPTQSTDCPTDPPTVTCEIIDYDTDITATGISYLPLNISLKLDASTDGAGAFDASLKLDTKKLFASNLSLQQASGGLITDGIDSLNLDIRAILSDKKYFLRTNLNSLTGDTKWLAGEIPAESAKAATDGIAKPETVSTKLSDEDKKDLIALATKVVKDHGIERRNNTPYAHYELVIDKDAQKIIEDSKFFKDQHITSSPDATNYETYPTINLWVSPRTARVGYMTVAMKSVANDIRTDFTMTYDMQYGTPISISAPAKNDVNPQTLEEIIRGLFSSTIKSDQHLRSTSF